MVIGRYRALKAEAPVITFGNASSLERLARFRPSLTDSPRSPATQQDLPRDSEEESHFDRSIGQIADRSPKTCSFINAPSGDRATCRGG